MVEFIKFKKSYRKVIVIAKKHCHFVLSLQFVRSKMSFVGIFDLILLRIW